MRILAVLRHRRSAVAAILLTLHLTACSTWQVAQPTPERPLPPETSAVRATLADGRTVELLRPAIVRDTLVGEQVRPRVASGTGTIVRYPMTDVRELRLERTSAGKTLLWVGVTLAALSGVAILAWSSSDCCF